MTFLGQEIGQRAIIEVSPDLLHAFPEKRTSITDSELNLPMKKKKLYLNTKHIQADILTQYTPWIGMLRQTDKQIITDQKCLITDIMNNVNSIIAKQFPQISGFQHTLLASVFDNEKKIVVIAQKS